MPPQKPENVKEAIVQANENTNGWKPHVRTVYGELQSSLYSPKQFQEKVPSCIDLRKNRSKRKVSSGCFDHIRRRTSLKASTINPLMIVFPLIDRQEIIPQLKSGFGIRLRHRSSQSREQLGVW